MVSSQFVRYVIAGAVNTLLSYLVYFGLVHLTNYQVAYAVSYVVGISLNYLAFAYWVFRVPPSLRSLAAWPLNYGIQYLISAGLLWALVETLHIDRRVAPLLIVAVMVPVSFALSRWIFRPKS